MAGQHAVVEEEVHCVTLDQYCIEHGIEHIDTLKIDVQGFESKVLRGARSILENVGQIMIESTWMEPETVEIVFKLLERFPHAAVVNPVAFGADIVMNKLPIRNTEGIACEVTGQRSPLDF